MAVQSDLLAAEKMSNSFVNEINFAGEFHSKKVGDYCIQDFYKPFEYQNFHYATVQSAEKVFGIDTSICPDLDHFKCVKVGLSAASYKGDRIQCFHDGKVLKSLIDFIGPWWNSLSQFDRDTCYFYLGGFHDVFNDSMVGKVEGETREISQLNANVREYIQDEVKLGRMFGTGKKEPFEEHICSKIMCIVEPKMDTNGVAYSKVRKVYNNVVSNSIIEPHGWLCKDTPLKFSTPLTDNLFEFNGLYEKLQSASHGSVFDKKDFYRQIWMHPKSWKLSTILTNDKRYWVDTNGRMGSRSSAIYAQRVSNLIDKLYNLLGLGFALTNQDDTLILGSSKLGDEKFCLICQKMGIVLNAKKSQFSTTVVTWCGYTLDLLNKSLQVKVARISKMKKWLQEVKELKFVKRRKFAQILGMFYSCRLVLFGLGVGASPAMFYTRKISSLYQQYYTEEELKNDIYEVLIPVKEISLSEITFMIKMLKVNVKFGNIRRNYGKFMAMGYNVKILTKDCGFSDASDSSFGFGLLININGKVKCFSFAKRFNSIQSKWSINVKEAYSLVMMKMYYLVMLEHFGCKGEKRAVTIYTDNNTTLSIASKQRVGLRSVELGVISKLIFALDLYYGNIQWYYNRVSTELNRWSDALSRLKYIAGNVSIGCPINCLVIGIHNFNQNPASYILDKFMKFGHKDQSMKKIELK